MVRYFHVTSSLNRESIRTHGLDWTRMGAAPGIAGSTEPEQEGCFVCLDEFELDWFLGFHDRGTVDVWAVDGIDEGELVQSPEGHFYRPNRVHSDELELLRTDVPPRRS